MSTKRSRALALLVLLILVVSLAAGCAQEPAAEAPPTEAPDAAQDAVPETQEEDMHVSEVKVEPGTIVVMETSRGTIKLELYPDVAPNHAATFVELGEQGFYDGVKFHRIIQGFMAQGGDPNTKKYSPEEVASMVAVSEGGKAPEGSRSELGTGGPGFTLEQEFNEKKHVRGTLSAARSQDPNSAGSQFFICFAPQPSLDGQYTVFGQVVEGMDVVDALKVGDEIESVKVEAR
jgi:cyclophilin family peptidyl-prolyl cis-trans isomerase